MVLLALTFLWFDNFYINFNPNDRGSDSLHTAPQVQSNALVLSTMLCTVMPKCSKSVFAGAEAPKPDIPMKSDLV